MAEYRVNPAVACELLSWVKALLISSGCSDTSHPSGLRSPPQAGQHYLVIIPYISGYRDKDTLLFREQHQYYVLYLKRVLQLIPLR